MCLCVLFVSYCVVMRDAVWSAYLCVLFCLFLCLCVSFNVFVWCVCGILCDDVWLVIVFVIV